MGLLPLSLIFLGAVVLITLVAALGTAKFTDMIIGGKHRAIEEIVDTDDIPASWRRRFDGKIARLRQDAKNTDKVARLERKARDSYLKKLDGLIGYMRATRLVESEEARRMVLDKLHSVRQKWAKQGGEHGERR